MILCCVLSPVLSTVLFKLVLVLKININFNKFLNYTVTVMGPKGFEMAVA